MRDSLALRALEFSKYRVFEQKQRLELRPLTLLFGLNSAGKSAALRFLPILAASVQRNQRESSSTILDYASPALRDALFQDLIHNGQVSAGLQFGFEWDIVKYDLTMRDLGADGEVVTNFNAAVEGRSYSGGLTEDAVRQSFEVTYENEKSQWTLGGLRPVHADTADSIVVVDAVRDCLDHFASSVHWLGAVRAAVPRIFELRPGSKGRIKPDGSGLAESIRISAAANDGAAEAVSKWLEKTCQCKLSFASSDEALAFNRRFFPFNVVNVNGRHIAVRDVGEGVAQALPVVMLCHQARLRQLGSSPILAFEQPELHLHPAASVHLADEIMACIAGGSPAAHVIETHAESMLLSVQIAIVEGRVQPADVVVYWVSADETGTSLRPIRFDNDGFPVGGWPQGVFRETLEQARQLSRLRSEQRTV